MIHALSDVQSNNIGNDTLIWQYAVILKGAVIGNNCKINCHCLIENDVIIGDYVTIKPGVQIWDGIHIEDNVFIGPNVTFTNDMVPRSKSVNTGFDLKRTLIKKGASIGANSTVIAGIEIGEYSFIGAGSVVTKSVAPFTVWYGNPATHRGYVTVDGVLLNLDFVDKKSNEKYKFQNEKLVKDDKVS
ncbi:acyltransferase [Mucilaginibacter galii]|uniref:N-acetyltransferase n=1 Tax=Mucilaginibacter galii TaxID=2005073 RepID=A0A917JD09_9SPHI|nr:acyltransferase [Mucilaginibacter galii]GGI51464.1 hypothetical protein GCM10011425_26760 [Mucilaginibacter galii]